MRALTILLSFFLAVPLLAKAPDPKITEAFQGIPFDDTTAISEFDPEAFQAENFEEDFDPKAFGIEEVLPEAPSIQKSTFPLEPDFSNESLIAYLEKNEGFSAQDAQQVSKEILSLFQEMRKQGRQLESENLEEFEDRLDRSKMTVKENHGRAKVTKVDGVKWIKVVHERTQTAFLFFNSDKVQSDSQHFHLIVSNMHFNAGKHVMPEDLPEESMQKARRKGALFGRNVAVAWYHERSGQPDDLPTVDSVNFYSKPATETERYDYEFKLACDKPFSWGNLIVNGTIIGAAQVAVLVGLNKLSPHIPYLGGHMDSLNPYVLLFTFAYSHYAGGWMYPKLRARSQRLTYNARFWLRGLTISLPYAIIYKAFVTRADLSEAALAGSLPLALFFLKQAINIGVNFYINNRVSNELNEHTQLDQELRTQTGNVKWFEKYLGLKVRRIDLKGQERYVSVSFTARTVDLNDNFRGVQIPIPFLDTEYFLSAGKTMYLGLAPLLRYTVLRRAEKAGTPLAVQYRARWENSLTGMATQKIQKGCRNLLGLFSKTAASFTPSRAPDKSPQ